MPTDAEYLKARLCFLNCRTVLDAVEKLEADSLNQADRMKSLERQKRNLDQQILELECEMNRTHLDLQFFKPKLEEENNEHGNTN